MKTSIKTWIDVHTVIANCRDEEINNELYGNSSYNKKLTERIAWLDEQLKLSAPKLEARRAKLEAARKAKLANAVTLER